MYAPPPISFAQTLLDFALRDRKLSTFLWDRLCIEKEYENGDNISVPKVCYSMTEGWRPSSKAMEKLQCPKQIVTLITACWQQSTEERLTFPEISLYLKENVSKVIFTDTPSSERLHATADDEEIRRSLQKKLELLSF
jgi:hypothetical protein